MEPMSKHWTSDGSANRVGACPDFLGEDTGWDVKFPVQGHMANTGPQGPGTTWSQGSPAGLSRGGEGSDGLQVRISCQQVARAQGSGGRGRKNSSMTLNFKWGPLTQTSRTPGLSKELVVPDLHVNSLKFCFRYWYHDLG